MPGWFEADIVGQLDRQILFRDRDDAAGRAVDDRDRAAPIALPRYAPIAQPVLDRAVAAALRLEMLDHRALGIGHGQPVEETGIDRDAVG
ncbi:MAG: hypothetical protein WDN69_36880 [Aliidongia sp.]